MAAFRYAFDAFAVFDSACALIEKISLATTRQQSIRYLGTAIQLLLFFWGVVSVGAVTDWMAQFIFLMFVVVGFLATEKLKFIAAEKYELIASPVVSVYVMIFVSSIYLGAGALLLSLAILFFIILICTFFIRENRGIKIGVCC